MATLGRWPICRVDSGDRGLNHNSKDTLTEKEAPAWQTGQAP
jgi:hypothetical protein